MSLLQMSATAAVMILAVVLVRLLGATRLPKWTFLVLWGLVLCRLLIPFDVPSPISAYNAVSPEAAQAVQDNPVVRYVTSPAVLPIAPKDPGVGVTKADYGDPIYPGVIAWACGGAACGLFFLASYLHSRRRFREALPVGNPFVSAWQSQRKGRNVRVRVSDRVAAPLTYGVLRPVILLPKTMDLSETVKLGYVLDHELVHIRRFDAVWKLCFTAALCLHWFNPLVWLMYVLANRDLELSCDASVVRAYGDEAKAPYAMTLISMEARKSGLLPLCNSFSKSAIEQRVRAIMKLKKTTALAVLSALIVVVGVGTALATSAVSELPPPVGTLPDGYAQTHYPDLMALGFAGYEDLTINQYRAKIIEVIAPWDGTDRDFAKQIDHMTNDELLWSSQYTDKDAWFLLTTLRLTMMDGWQKQYVDGGGLIDGKEYGIHFTYEITEPDKLTVGERDRVLRGYLVHAAKEMVKRADLGNFTKFINYLADTYHADGLSISGVEYALHNYEDQQDAKLPQVPPSDEAEEPNEPRQNAPSTEVDYASVLGFLKEGYGSENLQRFNEGLLRAMNDTAGFYDSYWSVMEDQYRGEGSHTLTEAERAKLFALELSNGENAAEVKTAAGYPTTPGYSSIPQYWRQTGNAVLRMDLQVDYTTPGAGTLTVAERDAAVSGVVNGMRAYLDGLSEREIFATGDAGIIKKFNELIQIYSDARIVLAPMTAENMHHEVYDLTDNGAFVMQDGSDPVTFDRIEVRYYSDGSPYLHDTRTNRSDQTVSGMVYGMLAYDKDGNPLKLHWFMTDSSAESTYLNVVEADVTIRPGETYDVTGGWSLEVPTQVATARYCVQKVYFEDGMFWTNPNYDEWLNQFEGKITDSP